MGYISLDTPLRVEELEVAAEMREEGLEVRPAPLIKPMPLGKIIRALADNYGIDPVQVPDLLKGYLGASDDVRRLICASGAVIVPLTEKAPEKPSKHATERKPLTDKARAAVNYMIRHAHPVSAQEIAEYLYPEDADRGVVREGAGSSALRDARKAGYSISGAWSSYTTDDGSKARVYLYTLHDKEPRNGK